MSLHQMPRRLGWREKARQFLYGMTGFEFERQAMEMKGELETAFLMITLGDLIGIPVMPPLYALRILPYATPMIKTWKRRVLRERDIIEGEEFHLHGV